MGHNYHRSLKRQKKTVACLNVKIKDRIPIATESRMHFMLDRLSFAHYLGLIQRLIAKCASAVESSGAVCGQHFVIIKQEGDHAVNCCVHYVIITKDNRPTINGEPRTLDPWSSAEPPWCCFLRDIWYAECKSSMTSTHPLTKRL